MKKLILPCIAAATAASFAFASPADDVKAAAKKLADASNYSWTTTSQNAGGGGGGFGGGPVNGVTEKGGCTVITRETQNGAMQTVRKGEQVVMQNQDGDWVTMEEMMAQFANRGGGGGGGQGGAPAGGQGGNRGGGGRGGFGGGGSPADELLLLVDAAKDLKSADGAISGALTSEAVAQRLSFGRGGRGGGGGGQTPPAPANASGSVKFWVKDGAVVKYELHVKGTVQGRNGEMEVDRTTTTEIKNVGTTKVAVPEGAKKKLGA